MSSNSNKCKQLHLIHPKKQPRFQAVEPAVEEHCNYNFSILTWSHGLSLQMIRYTREELYSFYRDNLPPPAEFVVLERFCCDPVGPMFRSGKLSVNKGGKLTGRRKEEIGEMAGKRFQQSESTQAPRQGPASAVGWYYIDPQGTIHGPYDSSQMQTWYPKFPPNLPISVDGSDRNTFQPMNEVFPDPETAFKFNPHMFRFYGQRILDESEPLEQVFLDFEQAISKED